MLFFLMEDALLPQALRKSMPRLVSIMHFNRFHAGATE